MLNNKFVYSLIAVSAVFLQACSDSNENKMAASQAQLTSTVSPPSTPFVLEGFECIAEFKDQVEILGRGKDYPQFIGEDLEVELKKQDAASALVSANCLSEVELGVKFANATVDNESAQLLDYLEATFPLELVVFNGEENWILDVSLKYTVDGLASKEVPELTKTFQVNQSYDMDRKALKSLNYMLKKSDD